MSSNVENWRLKLSHTQCQADHSMRTPLIADNQRPHGLAEGERSQSRQENRHQKQVEDNEGQRKALEGNSKQQKAKEKVTELTCQHINSSDSTSRMRYQHNGVRVDAPDCLHGV